MVCEVFFWMVVDCCCLLAALNQCIYNVVASPALLHACLAPVASDFYGSLVQRRPRRALPEEVVMTIGGKHTTRKSHKTQPLFFHIAYLFFKICSINCIFLSTRKKYTQIIQKKNHNKNDNNKQIINISIYKNVQK